MEIELCYDFVNTINLFPGRQTGSHRGGIRICRAVCLSTTAYSRAQTFQANILTETWTVLEKLRQIGGDLSGTFRVM